MRCTARRRGPEGDAPRSVLILEFNNAAKDAELAHAASTHKVGLPCPSGAQHVLKRSARDLLMQQSTRRRRAAED
jgi:hypothetical protein